MSSRSATDLETVSINTDHSSSFDDNRCRITKERVREVYCRFTLGRDRYPVRAISLPVGELTSGLQGSSLVSQSESG